MYPDVEPISFGRRSIGSGKPVVVIAEVGINHEGNPDDCFRLIEASARAGADAVKLQTILADENYAPDTESHRLFKNAELRDEDTARAFELAKDLGMECFSTCADDKSFDFVESLNPVAWKISSGLLTHTPLIRKAARTGRPLLLSTGMTGLDEAKVAVSVAREAGARELGVFQCTSIYPAPPETLDLRAIPTLSRALSVQVGLSDHSHGILAPALSVALGATMIEKHISLDPNRPGYDHPVSLDPEGFAEMIRAIRTAELMMGSGDKVVPQEVQERAHKFLRCLAARRDIRAGSVITADDVAVMRLSANVNGLSPESLGAILGKCARRDIMAFEAITDGDIS